VPQCVGVLLRLLPKAILILEECHVKPAAAVLTDDPRGGLVFRQKCTLPDVADVPQQSPEAMGLDGFLSGCRR
jgi:hypothetical protein